MTLSIIIPTFNEATGIEAQLVGLQPLRERGVELLLVDGGSQDPTWQLAAPYVTQRLRSNPGRAVQMNLGATNSHGDHLLFLHADTRLPQGADRLILDALSNGRCWGRFSVHLEGQHFMLKVIARAMNLRSRLTGIATGDQGLFVRRDAFNKVGGFPEQPLMEDIEISRRLKRLSPPACLNARVISSGRRWERHGVFRTILLMWRLRYRYWRGEDSEQLAKAYRHAR